MLPYDHRQRYDWTIGSEDATQSHVFAVDHETSSADSYFELFESEAFTRLSNPQTLRSSFWTTPLSKLLNTTILHKGNNWNNSSTDHPPLQFNVN